MNETYWHGVYDVLVRECGASERDRRQFVHYGMARAEHPDLFNSFEWRFQGDLGFGGKLKAHRFGLHGGKPLAIRFYVDCYPDDETDERERKAARANLIRATRHVLQP